VFFLTNTAENTIPEFAVVLFQLKIVAIFDAINAVFLVADFRESVSHIEEVLAKVFFRVNSHADNALVAIEEEL